jgi:hypothetical protein
MGGDLTAAPGAEGGMVFRLSVPVTVLLHPGDGAEKSVSEPDGDKTDLS